MPTENNYKPWFEDKSVVSQSTDNQEEEQEFIRPDQIVRGRLPTQTATGYNVSRVTKVNRAYANRKGGR